MADEMTLWWENMAGPRMLIEKIATELSGGKSVILRLNGRLPWQSCMRDFLAHQLSSVQIKQAVLERGGQHELVPQLLRQLNRSRSGQCPRDYKLQISYLKEERIFQESVVWLQPEPDCALLPVVQFLSDFRGKGLAESGCFVLEVSADQRLPKLSGGVAVLDCEEVIRADDVQLFASILADGVRDIPDAFRGYAARLAAYLAGRNGELVPILFQHIKADEDPITIWDTIENECGPDMTPHRPRPELEQLIWQAQLQTVFADIEMERLRITAQWENQIMDALKTEAWDLKKGEIGFVRQFGEEMESAADVELGTLVRMMQLRRNGDRSQRLLYVSDETERNWVHFLSKCRNKLAHHAVCSPEEMMSLLSRSLPQEV